MQNPCKPKHNTTVSSSERFINEKSETLPLSQVVRYIKAISVQFHA